MNLPNKLTVLRVLMIPFFVVFLLYDGGARHTWAVSLQLAIFIHGQPDGSVWTEKLPESIIWSPTSESLWIRWRTSCWSVRR